MDSRPPAQTAPGIRIYALFAIPLALLLWSAIASVLHRDVAPFVDQWTFLGEVQRLEDHGLSLAWLTAPHNEHRIITSRPLFLIDLYWFHGQNLFLLACIAVIQVLAAVLFIRLIGMQTVLQVAASALACALLFCMMQSANFTQGFQVQFVGVFAAAAWAIWLFAQGRTAGAIILLLVATCTMANGFLAGAAMTVMAAWSRRWGLAFAMLALTGALLALYLPGLPSDPDHVALHRAALTHPVRWIEYVGAYLGGIWWPVTGRSSITSVVGLAGLGACAWLILRRRTVDANALALAGIVLFLALSAMVTGYGRVAYGMMQAHDSRYGTPSAYMWAATIGLWARAEPNGRIRLLTVGVIGICLAAMLPLQWFGYEQNLMGWRRQAEAANLLKRGADDQQAIGVTANFDPVVTRQTAVNARSIIMMKQRRWSVWAP